MKTPYSDRTISIARLNAKIYSQRVSLINYENLVKEKKEEIKKLQIQLKNDFQNEHCKRLQAEDDNIKLESILKDRDDTVNKLSSLNDALKEDREKLINGKNNLLADVERYI